MRITTIGVTYSRTFNLGDYNSAKFEFSLQAELDDGDDPSDAESVLWNLAKDSIKAQALPVLRKRKATIDAIRDSLPSEVLDGIKE